MKPLTLARAIRIHIALIRGTALKPCDAAQTEEALSMITAERDRVAAQGLNTDATAAYARMLYANHGFTPMEALSRHAAHALANPNAQTRAEAAATFAGVYERYAAIPSNERYGP